MIIKTVRVSEKGQIALPKEVRDIARIGQGTDLLLILQGDRILLEPIEFLSGKVEEDFRDLQHHAMESLQKVWDNDSDERWSKELLAAARHRTRSVPVHGPKRKQDASRDRRLKR